MERDYDDDFQETMDDEDIEDTAFDLHGINIGASAVSNDEKITKKAKAKDTGENKIEISIDSVESLVSNLSYSAKELENAVDRVEKNRELSKILDLLTKIKMHDYSDVYENIEKNIDISKIENQISKKIDTSINANLGKVEFKKLESASKRYEKYGEIFESVEVMDTFEQINDLEIFMKKFKFKSIVTAVIITSIISFTAAFLSVGAYYSYSNSSSSAEPTTKTVVSADSNLDYFMNGVSFQVAGNDEITQLIIKNSENLTFHELENGKIIIQKKNK